METQLKNQWIALEEQYHTLLKEKVKEHNLKNTTKIPTPVISSQLIFCKDGVVIKKTSNPENKSGISVMVNNKSILEIKSRKETLDEINMIYNYLDSFKLEEVNNYEPIKIVDQHLHTLSQSIN